MAGKGLIKAVGYLRTSSQTNVGDGKDTDKRQREAIQEFAQVSGYEIVAWYWDVTKGENGIHERPQFAAMMERLLSNGVRTIIVETANRFARDLMVQEVGFKLLKDQGIDLIAADKPDAFLDDTPTAVLVRQVLGAVAQFEKAMVVSKLKGARDRKKAATGKKVEGRKNYAERSPEATALAKKLKRYHGLSLREISAELSTRGHLSAAGTPFEATAIRRMLTYRA